MKLIRKIGFFRLLLTPLGILIMISAYQNHIWGMGLVGLVILVFGLLNRCLTTGKCETDL